MHNSIEQIQGYFDYWDTWHKEWYELSRSVSKNQTPNFCVNDWPLLDMQNPKLGIDDEEGRSWRYFPEPYWGTFSEDLFATFININPGGGGICQDIASQQNEKSILYEIYENNNKSYRSTINKLSKNTCYITTNWFETKRVNWIKCFNLFYNSEKQENQNISVHNIFCTDLIPWHTSRVNAQVNTYIERNKDKILDYVITPTCLISKHAVLKNTIIAKGKNSLDILSKLLGTSNLNSYKRISGKTEFTIDIFHYMGCNILVFKGGQGMVLPNASTIYNESKSNKSMTVKDILEECMNLSV